MKNSKVIKNEFAKMIAMVEYIRESCNAFCDNCSKPWQCNKWNCKVYRIDQTASQLCGHIRSPAAGYTSRFKKKQTHLD